MNGAILNKKVWVYGAGVESGAINIKEKNNVSDYMKYYNHITNMLNNGVC